ncbi:unnamed protein product [Mytilus edulis]|uniref:DDE Tnp4 domain-containing protein n=1 Tax=Mytilus edulis TaxID=6550 RepID=A0A8S3RXM8_MYTED|nr:unnamed protein product [Mytilus edulis]
MSIISTRCPGQDILLTTVMSEIERWEEKRNSKQHEKIRTVGCFRYEPIVKTIVHHRHPMNPTTMMMEMMNFFCMFVSPLLTEGNPRIRTYFDIVMHYDDQEFRRNFRLTRAHCHLVGDAAYPLCTNLMTPFKDIGNLTRQQQRYNFCQSSTRMVIERSIGQLKGRFRKLKMLDCSRPKTGNFTKFCCCLHNLCISGGDLLQDDEMDMEEQVNNGPAPPQPAAVVGNASQKRQNIMQQL